MGALQDGACGMFRSPPLSWGLQGGKEKRAYTSFCVCGRFPDLCFVFMQHTNLPPFWISVGLFSNASQSWWIFGRLRKE